MVMSAQFHTESFTKPGFSRIKWLKNKEKTQTQKNHTQPKNQNPVKPHQTTTNQKAHLVKALNPCF